jgi:hypothetical protein
VSNLPHHKQSASQLLSPLLNNRTDGLITLAFPKAKIQPPFDALCPVTNAQKQNISIHDKTIKICITPSSGESSPYGEIMLILLIVLILVFGFGGYRMGPGIGYYGGGGVSLILLIVLILLLMKVI